MSIAHDIDKLRAEGRWLAAAAVYATCVETEMMSGPRWVQLAHMLKEGGALTDAEYAYRTATKVDGTDADARLHLAHLLKQQGKLSEALSEFEALAELPQATNVLQEIRGLQVALHPDNCPIAASFRLKSNDGPHRDALQRLKERQAEAEAETARLNEQLEEAAHVEKSGHPDLRRMAFGKLLDARIVPKANLVIEDNVFVATTENPQFDILFDRKGPESGWVEIELGIDSDAPVVEPIFYVEHQLQWQQFSFWRLAPRNGRFHAVCLLKGPVFRLRLDPVQFSGAFKVTFFKMRQIGLARALRAAWRIDPAAVRGALKNWHRLKNRESIEATLSQVLRYPGVDTYRRWIERFDTFTSDQIAVRQRLVARWPKPPMLTLLIACDPDQMSDVSDTLASLSTQFYASWKAHLISRRPVPPRKMLALKDLCIRDDRILVTGDLLSAVQEANDGFFVTVVAGLRLAPSALFMFAERIVTNPGAELIYGDEDHISGEMRCLPLFKPNWDPDFQASSDYIGSFVAIRHDRLRASLDSCSTSSPDWFELIARSAFQLDAQRIQHVASILSHRPLSHRGPSAAGQAQSLRQQRREIIGDVLRQAGSEVALAEGAFGLNRLMWPEPSEWPHVTLVIPTRDHATLLRKCIQSVLAMTSYPSFDIIVVDNESVETATHRYFEELKGLSNVAVLSVPGPFNFSKLNNVAIRAARGDIVGLINNDVLAIHKTWLKEMVLQAIRPEIGAVGAKLLYKSGHVQHAGIACGIGLVAGHPHKFRDRDDPGEMHRLVTPHGVSAVTAACLVVDKRKYLDVGGLDEDHLAVAFNDVDFCIKLTAAGYRNLFTPYAELFHLESITRGLDTTPEKQKRYRAEAQIVLNRWPEIIKNDPYYNINLTREREDYSPKL
ncbi:glycosyltransferase [Rhizobium giardinii]|uniref:GT2 family glycosyltransferase n=1 Tax=Rhizobium giardinii TaxID=56731 RepID=A0A7W8XAQ6_9HYPH|nr:glycosyltransferase [Rhizobium giardinii]MBB5539645.1 GT2 family glycosyltransferase [Rhizobium giardinii]